MKAIAAITALAALTTFSSVADAAQIRFRGGITFTSVKNCVYLYAGDTFSSTFRPASSAQFPLGDNPAVTSLSHLSEYSGDIYELNGNFVLNRWQKVDGNGFGNEHYSFPASIKITSQMPAQIDSNTKFVTFTGLISKASNDPGVGGRNCVVSFRAAYFRRYEY